VKVLALMTDAYGGYGGIAQYNRDFTEALAGLEEVRSVDLVTRLAPLPLPALPPKVRQHAAIRSRVRYALKCLRLGASVRPQIVVNGHLYHGPLARHISWLTGARLVSQLHGTEVWGQLRQDHIAALRASDLILCVSRNTRAQVLSQARDLKDKIEVLPNMVGSQFRPVDRALARARFGLQQEKVILTVARLDGRKGYKGHDEIIRMLPALAKEHGGAVRYVIAGEGEDRPRLETLARELGVAELTDFLGRVEADALPDLYSAADVFAMPSTGEGFGIVYLEAMACGTPAIGLDVGGVRDAFADGRLWGCVSRSEFPSALREALRQRPMQPEELSAAVQARFGFASFQARIRKITQTLGTRQ
jgi:phosphatidyl-myo-inositol dimannoside synthase